MAALAGLGAALLALGIFLLYREANAPESTVEIAAGGVLAIGLGSAVLDVGLSG